MNEIDDTNAQGPVTRRSLLASGGAAALALALPGVGEAAVRKARRVRRPSHLRRSSYHSLVGQRFRVEGSSTRLRLVAVKDLTRRQRGSENSFSLTFQAPRRARLLRNQVPTLHHPRLGSFQLLLSPGMASGSGQPYVAVINRTRG